MVPNPVGIGRLPIPRTVWLSSCLLAPATAIRGSTVWASRQCMEDAWRFAVFLLGPYAGLGVLIWILRRSPAAAATLAVGTAVITCVPLMSGLTQGLFMPSHARGYLCGASSFGPQLFAVAQVGAAVLTALLAGVVWLVERRTRQAAGNVLDLHR